MARGGQGQRPALPHLHPRRQQERQERRVLLLPRSRKVTFEEGLRFAKEQGIAFLETSAKTGNNVEEIFTVLTETILGKIEEGSIDVRNHPGVKVGQEKYLGMREELVQGEKEVKIDIGKSQKKSKTGCCGK